MPANFEYTRSSNGEMFQALQSLRQHGFFCDVKLQTDDGAIILGHKVVLAAASPYFQAMFTNFEEKNKDLVIIRGLDSTALQLLVDFIYLGKIVVTKKNVQDLLAVANLLQLNDVNEVCCEFIQKQLNPTNCFSIKDFADLYSCSKLLTSSELFIRQNFLKVVKADKFRFVSLSSEQLVKLISCDNLTVPSEEKVFECVIRWIYHDLDSRKCFLAQLMEHVRLGLTSENYINQKVLKEPILNNCPKCIEYINEASQFHILKRSRSDGVITIPECVRYKPRLGDKVILVVGGTGQHRPASRTEWYDPKTNRWNFLPKNKMLRYGLGLCVLYDHFVFAMGGDSSGRTLQSVVVLDLFSESPCWKQTVKMLVKRGEFGVGVINNNLYAVGGFYGDYDSGSYLNSAEKFDCSTKEWRMVSSMSTGRCGLAVGVLNNILYAVGGCNDDESGNFLNSVECYHPSLDTWKPVTEMSKCRLEPGVGVLDGVLYAVGGNDGSAALKSVETYRPSTGVWTTIADMNFPRQAPGVVASDGFLYVIGGVDDEDIPYNSVEFYNPISNKWFMLEARMNEARCCAGVVTIVRPPHFKNC